MSRVIPAYLPVAAGFVFVATRMLTPVPAAAPRVAAATAASTAPGLAFPEAQGRPPPIPESWRAEKPEDLSPGVGLSRPLERPRAALAGSVRHSGCAEVRAAGAAPLLEGEPGYRPERDGDDDGIACEPRRY
jgi:hypothetical protein